MTDFPEFTYSLDTPQVSYPKIIPNAAGAFVNSKPTCSWMQNAIVDNVPPSGRFFNQVPWYVIPNYDNTEYAIGLKSGFYVDIIQDTTDGNLGQVDDYSPDILISRTNSSVQTLALKSYDDLGCMFSADESFQADFCRGAAYCTFTENGQIIVRFIGTPSLNLSAPVPRNGHDTRRIELIKARTKSTSYFRNFSDTIEGSIFTSNLFNDGVSNKYSFVNNNGYYSFKFSTTSGECSLFCNIQESNFAVTDVVATGITNVTTHGNIFKFTMNYRGVVTDVEMTCLFGPTMQVITNCIYQETQVYTLVTKLGSALNVNGSTLTSVGGYVQIAAGNSENILSGAGQNSVAGSLNILSETEIQMKSNSICYLSRAWLAGFTYNPQDLTILGDIFESTTYGPLKLCRFNQVTFKSKITVPSLLPSKALPGAQTYLPLDVDLALSTMALVDQYAFGTKGYSAIRLLLLAKASNIPLTGKYLDLFKLVEKNMTEWLNGTNTNFTVATTCSQPAGGPNNNQMFILSREKYWGGIISPADYYNFNASCYYPLGGFGNSYYNDHHFQWGYFYYILAGLANLGSNILVTYRTRVTSLLLDVCNPITDVNATKTRHKDWYAGHSWATGFQPASKQNYSGPIERNEESGGEATNCYYSAYHLAKALQREDVASTASMCYMSEIAAVQAYNFRKGDDVTDKFFQRTPVISLLGNRYRKCTVLYGTAPPEYWGRMNSIVDILFLPFGETSPQLLTSQFVTNVENQNVDPFTNNTSYQVNAEKLQNLGKQIYIPQLAVNDRIVPLPGDKFVQWNPDLLLMLKFLCLGSIPPSQAQAILSHSFNQQKTAIARATKDMDSYSNTAYWLNNYNKLVRFNSNVMMIDPGVETGMSCDFPPITPESLLENSDFKSQGLVKVPLIYGLACLDNQRIVREIKYQVLDNVSYKSKKQLKLCCNGNCYEHGVCPKDVVLTEYTFLGSCVDLIDYAGETYWDKAVNIQNGVTGDKLLQYSSLRLVLTRLLRGNFDCRYLLQRYRVKFEEDLKKSRFCNFWKAFVFYGIEDYWMYYKK